MWRRGSCLFVRIRKGGGGGLSAYYYYDLVGTTTTTATLPYLSVQRGSREEAIIFGGPIPPLWRSAASVCSSSWSYAWSRLDAIVSSCHFPSLYVNVLTYLRIEFKNNVMKDSKISKATTVIKSKFQFVYYTQSSVTNAYSTLQAIRQLLIP